MLGFTQAWELFKLTQTTLFKFSNSDLCCSLVLNKPNTFSCKFWNSFFFLLSQLIESFIRRIAPTYYIVLLFVIICEKLSRWHLPFKYPLINNFLNGTPLPGIVVIELRHHMVSPSPSAFVAPSIFLEPKEQKCSALVLM